MVRNDAAVRAAYLGDDPEGELGTGGEQEALDQEVGFEHMHDTAVRADTAGQADTSAEVATPK